MSRKEKPQLPTAGEVEFEPSTDVVTFTADPAKVREIITEYNRYLGIVGAEASSVKSYFEEPEKGGKGEGITSPDLIEKYEKIITAIVALSHKYSGVACGDVRIYIPSLMLEERVISDATLMCTILEMVQREVIYPYLKQLYSLVSDYMKLDEKSSETREQLKTEIVSRFVQLIKFIKASTGAKVVAIANILSTRSLNLPAELRSSLINMQVIGADISYSTIYRVLRRIQELEQKKRKITPTPAELPPAEAETRGGT